MKLAALTLASFVSLQAFSQTRFVTIDSTAIAVNVVGMDARQEGQPVLVFESGYGTPMGHWDRLVQGAAALAPLVIYDRPGIGASEPDDQAPTIKHASDRLVRLLNHLHIKPPYVLVGHSLGGLYVRGFAVYYPQLLAGLVIIDPADFTENNQNQRDYYTALGWDDEKIDRTIAELAAGLANRNKDAPRAIREEGRVLGELRESEFKELKGSPLPNIPVHIITGGRFDAPPALKTPENEAIFRSKVRHRIARWIDVVQSVDKGMFLYSGDAGHFVHHDDPELVVSSLKMVLQDYQLQQIESKK